MMENFVFLQLRRKRGYVFYYKGILERDFVHINHEMKKSVFQLTYDLSGFATKEKEINGLVQSMNYFKLNSVSILTLFEEDELQLNGKPFQ